MNKLLVAIPVWPGDYEQVLANLRRQKERDGQCDHHAMIFVDTRLHDDGKLQSLAKDCFAKFATMRCQNPKANLPWPVPQNFVWQFIARKIMDIAQDGCRGWFLWESDAAPLKDHWLDTLADAYVAGRRPFMGHVVPGRGHMNAVAVYPFNIPAYCTTAMLVKDTPFDIALSKEIGQNNITPANHLIAHRLKPHGGSPADPLTSAVIKSLPETTVIAHGYVEQSPAQIQKHKESRKEQAMNETSKAMRRRRCEEAAGGFKWSEVFKGVGVDVGAGNDPIQIPGCRPFDMLDGDANHLSNYFEPESLDYVHSSQSLEHMRDPRAALLNWSIPVKKGGYLVVTVPDFDVYEKRHWPSRFNPDHKSAWSLWRKSDAVAPLVNVPELCRELLEHGLWCEFARLVDTNYDYSAPDTVDQTLPNDGAECFIEMVFHKRCFNLS